MKEQIQGLHEELHKAPVTLEELKQVLNTINNIRSSSMVMELRYTDLEERFRCTCRHFVQCNYAHEYAHEYARHLSRIAMFHIGTCSVQLSSVRT